MYWREKYRGPYVRHGNDVVRVGVEQQNPSINVTSSQGQGPDANRRSRFDISEEQQGPQTWRTVAEWRAILQNGGAGLSEQERVDLGLDQIDIDMGDEALFTALDSDDEWEWALTVADPGCAGICSLGN